VLAVNQGDLYQYLVNTEDPDQNDTRVIRALTLPSWMTIEDRGDGTALVFGEPTNEEVGTHSVVLEVTDALGSKDTQTYSVEVININDAPRFTSEPITIARVGETYEYEITVIDIDANAVLEVAANGLPGWLSLGDLSDGRALLSGIPPVEEVNKQFDIQIVVTDDGGLQSDQQFTLRTEYPNIPPTIQQISDITGIPEDSEPLQITLSGISAGGGENQALSVAATASNNELFSAVDIAYTSPSANGLLTLTPAPNAFGTSEITITVTDDGDANLNTFAISFNVSIDAVNDAPVFVSSPVTKLSLGEPYTYAIETRDDDPDDVLTITSLNLPSWLTLLDNGDGTALLEGTAPDNADPIEITLLVSDNAGAQTEQTFILQVNRRPELQDVFIAAFEDSVYVFKLADFLTGYFDANGDVPQGIRIQELPVHGVLTFNGSAVVTDQVLVPSNGSLLGLEYLPEANFNGTDEFLWNISDGEVEAAEPASMILDVQPVNDPPVISNLESAPISYSQGQGDVFVTVTATITDIDDNQIAGARVAITSNYVRGEDVLQYTRELTPDISVEFDEQNGILSFDGISTKSQYDVALNNVRYRNNRVGEIDLTTKEISIQAIDEDGLGPRAVRLIQITEVFPELDLVNAFTPNGDGVNDVWDIGNLPAYRNAALSIFDGNGNEVYQCNGTDCVWDGKMGGRSLPAGPYYYVIKLNDGQQVYRGTVSILK
jgi:gliding motility-associated-like protein